MMRHDGSIAVMVRLAVILWPLWLLGGLLGACGATQQPEPLPEAVRGYNDAVRWQRFDAAAAHLPASERDHFLDLRDRLHEDLRIHNYEVIRIRYDGSQTRARVQVKLTWHSDSRGIVHRTHFVQTWQRVGKRWQLTREQHLRGEPIPGLSVPAENPTGDPAVEPHDLEIDRQIDPYRGR